MGLNIQKILSIAPHQKAIIAGFSETEQVRETSVRSWSIYKKTLYVEEIGLAVKAELAK